MKGFRASEVFAALLYKKGWNRFKADPVEIHKIFYDLYQENPRQMENFKFTKRTNPFSITLDELITLFQLSGVLSVMNPQYSEFQVHREVLEKFLPKELSKLDNLKGIDQLDRLCC